MDADCQCSVQPFRCRLLRPWRGHREVVTRMGGPFGLKPWTLAPLASRTFLISPVAARLASIYTPSWWPCGPVARNSVRVQKPFLANVPQPQPLLALKSPLTLCHGFHLPHGLACWCSGRGCRSPCRLNGGHHDSASGSQFSCLLTLNLSTCGTFWVLSLPHEGLRRAQEVKTATPHAHPSPSACC